MSEIGLDVGQANELKLAFRKFDYTNSDVKSLSEGNTLGAVRGVLRGTHKIVEIGPLPLLEVVGTITVSATTTKFVGSERFTEQKDGGDFYLGDNFKAWFLGKTEEPGEEIVLRVSRLTRHLLDAQVLKELGGLKKIGLSHFFAALADKRSRKDYTWAIAYIDDVNGDKRAVLAVWQHADCCWYVGASSAESVDGWFADGHVLSRNMGLLTL
jgi:hypothetical protein